VRLFAALVILDSCTHTRTRTRARARTHTHTHTHTKASSVLKPGKRRSRGPLKGECRFKRERTPYIRSCMCVYVASRYQLRNSIHCRAHLASIKAGNTSRKISYVCLAGEKFRIDEYSLAQREAVNNVGLLYGKHKCEY